MGLIQAARINWKTVGWILIGLILGGLLGLLVLKLLGVTNPNGPSLRQPPVVGAQAADFELPHLNGETVQLSRLKGKPVILNYWATWCPPCREEMPLLQQYAEKLDGKLVILGIDVQEAPAVVQPYVDQLGITFPILLDQSGKTAETYYTRNYPTSFFIDSNGVLQAQHMGQLTEDLLIRYLRTIGIEP